jgi:hypothetical protein
MLAFVSVNVCQTVNVKKLSNGVNSFFYKNGGWVVMI